MKNAKKLLSYSYFGFFTALLLSAPAFAYLDPGTVTYVVSMIAVNLRFVYECRNCLQY